MTWAVMMEGRGRDGVYDRKRLSMIPRYYPFGRG